MPPGIENPGAAGPLGSKRGLAGRSMSVSGDIGDFRDWWLEELRALLPVVRRDRTAKRRQCDYRIHLARDRLTIRRPAGDVAVETTLQDLAGELGTLFRTARQHQPTVEIVLEPGRYLERHLAGFRLPKRRAREMAALDVRSSTPLDPADVLLLFAKRDRTRPGHRCFIAKKQVLAPVVAAVEGASGRIAAVRIRVDGDLAAIEPDGYASLSAALRRRSFGDTIARSGILLCLVAAVATFAHAQWRYAEGSRRLDAMTEALEADVKAVRALSERRKLAVQQIESVRQQKRQSTPLVRIWEELTRVIGDDTWLSDLSVDGDKVTFTGISRSAAGLIADLDASPLFRGPAFSGPVTKAPGTGGERFTIEMRLEL